MTTHTIEQLKSLSLPALEAFYVRSNRLSSPTPGIYRGTVLRRLDTPGSRAMAIHLFQWINYELMPFGLRFFSDFGDWYTVSPRVTMGRFVMRHERSKWRETDAFTMNYESSKLPKFIRQMLYDELKPLSESLILGIGGTNAPRGQGDHFFFALEKIE